MTFAVAQFADVLRQKVDYIQLFSLFGMNSEGWLQAEFVHFLWQQQGMGHVNKFKPQTDAEPAAGARKLHDVCIELAENLVWCELKSFCTNYCGSPGKNITNRIDGILQAMDRVRERSGGACQIPLVVALLYPFCDGREEQVAWKKHRTKLTSGPLANCSEWKIRFQNSGDAYARLMAWTSPPGLHLLASAP
jgi:hypothetical protein